jgi:hypothetical protein
MTTPPSFCCKSQLGRVPKLNKEYVEGQLGFSKISTACLKSIDKVLVDEVLKDIVLPSFSNVKAIVDAIDTSFSTTAHQMSEANLITPDEGAHAASSPWFRGTSTSVRPTLIVPDSEDLQVSTVADDDDNNDDNNIDQETRGLKGIKAALELDFQKHDPNQKHPARLGAGAPIEISKRKMLTQIMRLEIVLLADAWGWESEKDTNNKKQIMTAACRVVCYDHGYLTPSKGSSFVEWHSQLHNIIDATMETTSSYHSLCVPVGEVACEATLYVPLV